MYIIKRMRKCQYLYWDVLKEIGHQYNHTTRCSVEDRELIRRARRDSRVARGNEEREKRKDREREQRGDRERDRREGGSERPPFIRISRSDPVL